MSPIKRTWAFFKRNPVLSVCVPGFVLIHWIWYRIQHVDIFVKQHERHEGADAMPLVRAIKTFHRKLTSSSEPGSSTAPAGESKS